jgi:hypothetical protein
MDRLFKSVLSIRELKFHVDDDHVDRLSRQYTVIILVCFAFLVSTKQFVGRPIHCWCPAEFTPSHRRLYQLDLLGQQHVLPAVRRRHTEGELQGDDVVPRSERISYYQWVPLILIVQGVLSFVPCQVWRFLNKRSGINLSAVMDAAHVSSEASYLEIREKAIRYIVNQMDRYLLAQRDYRTGCCVRIKHFIAKICCVVGGKLYGNYLITAYLVIKAVYVINAVGQLFLLDALLIDDYHLYGAYIVERLLRGQDWTKSQRFPRVTLCEFPIRLPVAAAQLRRPVRADHQPVQREDIPVRLVLVRRTGVRQRRQLLQWLFRALYWPGQVQYVRKQLRAFDTTQREPGILAKFTENYLRRDGMFIVRLIGINMGEVVAGEVLCGLWNNYSPERRLIAEKPGRKQNAWRARLNAREERCELVIRTRRTASVRLDALRCASMRDGRVGIDAA